MKKIWKYPLSITDEQQVDIPLYGEILCAQFQDEIPCIWVLVDPEQLLVPRYFEIFGTGHPIKEESNMNRKYIGTIQSEKYPLVWHVFERIIL